MFVGFAVVSDGAAACQASYRLNCAIFNRNFHAVRITRNCERLAVCRCERISNCNRAAVQFPISSARQSRSRNGFAFCQVISVAVNSLADFICVDRVIYAANFYALDVFKRYRRAVDFVIAARRDFERSFAALEVAELLVKRIFLARADIYG